MSLRDDLSGLPDGALVPVGWVRERLSGDPDTDAEPLSDLTVEDVASELDRSPSTVRGWLNREELRGYKLQGREWRVPRKALRAFLDGQTRGDDRPSLEDPDADLGSWREVSSG